MKEGLQGKGIRHPLHPLHPLLVHFPVALFVFSFVLDVVSWCATLDGATRGAFYTMALGVVTALVAAIPGFVDYSDIRSDHPAKRTGMIHMILNLAMVVLYAANLGLRYPNLDAAKTPLAALCMSILGITVLSISGYLGGSMVYGDGIGVGRHRRRSETPKRTLAASGQSGAADMVPVAREDSLRDGETLRVNLGAQLLCVAKSQGRLYAFQEFCTHRFGPLSEGVVCQKEIQCPWHRSVFDMNTGKVVRGPAKVDLKTFRGEARDGQIWIAPQSNGQSKDEPHDMAA